MSQLDHILNDLRAIDIVSCVLLLKQKSGKEEVKTNYEAKNHEKISYCDDIAIY